MAVLDAIRSGRWRVSVEAVRAAFARAGKDAANELKKRLPGVLWSGKFDRRCTAGLVAHSGLLCADLDALGDRLATVRERLQASPHLYAAFLSPTGTGLKAIFRVPADERQHAGGFAAVAAHVRDLAGVEIDQACKDVSRLCFVSFDPEAYLNRDAVELPPLAVPVVEPRLNAAAPNAVPGTLPPSVDRMIAAGAQAGERNSQAFKVACQLRDAGLSLSDGESRILEFAARCVPPLAPLEAIAALRSAYAAPRREPARSTTAPRLKIGSSAPETPCIADGPDAQTFARLAALPPADYDRVREDQAAKLGIRVGTLDSQVDSYRQPAGITGQGTAVEFAAVEPWPVPVDGEEVLRAIAERFRHYVALPSRAEDALTLWAAHAHAFEAFIHTPRLNLCSPEKGCGKTLVLDLLASLVPRPLRTESITPAVLFRLVELHKPVLLLDEIDTYLHEADELRGLLNAGHKRGAKAYRCEGDQNQVRAFAAFAPAVLAGIGTLPGTLHDRSLVVRLVRAKPGEVSARFDSRRTLVEHELCRKLARWAGDHRGQLEQLDPALPDGAFNRLADNWRPLFAVAHVAGGDWPRRAAAAFAALTSGDDMDAHGIGVALLADIRAIFINAGTDRLASKDIAERLAAMDGKPWPEFKSGKPITSNQLARLLARFKIHSRTVRIGDDTAKGYHFDDFEDAFARFLPDSPRSNRNTVTTRASIGDSPLSETSHGETLLPFETAIPACNDGPCDGVTLSQPGAGQEAGFWPDGCPISEPPGDLPPVDADGSRLYPDEEAVAV